MPERGPPAVGKAVKVKWTDGSLYGATFRGTNRKDMYRVGIVCSATFRVNSKKDLVQESKLSKFDF